MAGPRLARYIFMDSPAEEKNEETVADSTTRTSAKACETSEPFFGEESAYAQEKLKLIFEWHPIGELPHLPLYPSFFRTALARLPAAPEHIVHTDTENIGG